MKLAESLVALMVFTVLVAPGCLSEAPKYVPREAGPVSDGPSAPTGDLVQPSGDSSAGVDIGGDSNLDWGAVPSWQGALYIDAIRIQ
jgi:hypothetical protein